MTSRLRLESRRTRALSLMAVACAAALLAAACGSSASTSKATTASASSSGGLGKSQNLNVGVILPLSGTFASSGIPFEKGAQAAVNYLNAGNAKAKGVHYTLTSRDGQGTPTQDEALAKQLSQNGTKYFLGDVISATGYSAEQTAFNETKAISFSSVPVFDQAGIGKAYPWAYGVGGTDEIYEAPFVNYVKAHSKNGKVGVIYMDYQDVATWGTATASLARKDGLKVATESVPATATDVTAQLRSLRSSGADSLIIDSLDPITHAVLQGLNQIGWTPPVVAATSPSSTDLQGLPSSLVKNIVGGPVPETFLAASTTDQPQGQAATYISQYAPLVGQKGGQFNSATIFDGSYLFDAMIILDQAIAKAGTTSTAAVQTALDSGVTYQGSRGGYVYGPTNRAGPVTTNWGLYVVAAGCPSGTCQKAP